HQRMVVRQADHAGPELDMPRALGRDTDEQLGRGDDLPPGAVMLADPGLVETKAVEPLDQLEIALQRQRRVLRKSVEGRHKDAEAQAVGQGHVVLPGWWAPPYGAGWTAK